MRRGRRGFVGAKVRERRGGRGEKEEVNGTQILRIQDIVLHLKRDP